MKESNILKGVTTLKELAVNLRSFIEYTEKKEREDVTTLTFLDEMNHCCSILTDIFETEFLSVIKDKERFEDDGK